MTTELCWFSTEVLSPTQDTEFSRKSPNTYCRSDATAFKRFIGTLVAIVLLSLTVQQSVAQGQNPGASAVDVVIFDNSREQFWLPFDTGFFGYSELAISLREAGFLVSESTLPVTVSLMIEPRGSVLVMGPASGQIYSQKEIDAIVEYVKQGGGLIILAEPDVQGSGNFQNTLATKFGIWFGNAVVTDTANCVSETGGQWIYAESEFFGVKSISLPVCVSLRMIGPAFPVVSAKDTSVPAKAVVGAAANYGKGRVVCIGDSQFLVNGGRKEIGIHAARNKDLAVAIFSWLAGRETKSRSRIVPQYTTITGRSLKLQVRVEGTTDLVAHIKGGTIEPDTIKNASGEHTFTVEIQQDGFIEFVGSDGSRKTVVLLLSPGGGIGAKLLFDMRGYGPEMGDPINGLIQFAALLRDKGYWVWAVEEGLINLTGIHAIIVVNPLRADDLLYAGDLRAKYGGPNADALRTRELRWLFICEPPTAISVHNQVGEWLRARKLTDREVPIQAIANKFGIKFLPYVIFESDTSRIIGNHSTFPVLNFGIETCNAFRCGIVEADLGETVLLASNSAWGLEGGMGLRAGEERIERSQHDYSPPIVGILTENAIAVADIHIFSAQHLMTRGNWAFAMALADWLAGLDLEIPEP